MAGGRKWLGLFPTFIGSGIPTMMQVGPDDAILNFCKCPRKLAPAVPENCLPGMIADQLYVVAVVLICAGLLWFGWPYLNHGTKRARMLSGIFILCCGAGIGVFGLSIIAAGESSSAKVAETHAPSIDLLPLEEASRLASAELDDVPFYSLGNVATRDAPQQRLYFWAHKLAKSVPIYSGDGKSLTPATPLTVRDSKVVAAGEVGPLVVKKHELDAAFVQMRLGHPAPQPGSITTDGSPNMDIYENKAASIGVYNSPGTKVHKNDLTPTFKAPRSQ
jgi:hypothetical protein